ncbi:hypothetical protein BES34_003850 [Leptospira inadai serovar Lyme]|uniref:Uncharacterized protein n=2 Tax=Leptospira inadai TaxID=29506 RepID=A0ABX4YLK0_9LEPT|nr:hypothetical protein BES34_003850 [Leptospira inadai serovar Lyme]
MTRLGYVKNLRNIADELGYKVIEHRLFDYCSNPLNPTGLLIIEKNNIGPEIPDPFACPVTKAPLQFIRGSYYCKESLLVYPSIDNIPCLLSTNAVIATHYLDFE